MIYKDLNSIDENDLQYLVNEQVQEGKTLEYKEKLPGNKDKDKKEFLADVSSFANAFGGYLIYGISENREKGVPEKIIGINTDNPDKEINRLENIIKQSIEPRIPSLEIKSIKLSNSSYDHAIIFKVGNSWISPHRVTFKGHDKFYSRTSAGKFAMDVSELRTAFTLTENLKKRIQSFKKDQIKKISQNETPTPLSENPKIIIHLIPINAFNKEITYDLSDLEYQREIIDNLIPLETGAWNRNHNFDGFLLYSVDHSYLQLFRNGIIETTMSAFRDNGTLYSIYSEKEIVQSISLYLDAMRKLGEEPPILIYITLLNVKGYILPKNSVRSWTSRDIKVDRDILELPEIMIDSLNVEIGDVLKPVFDTVWNACGYGGSPNYDGNGKWNPE